MTSLYPSGVLEPPCLIQTIPGIGTGTHLGKTTFYSEAVACFHNMKQQGSLDFTAADGDQFFGYFEGAHASMPSSEVTFWDDFWITGGTGRFEGVTGVEEVQNRHNLAALDELLSPDMIDRSAMTDPPGLKGIRAFFTMMFATFPDMHFAIQQ